MVNPHHPVGASPVLDRRTALAALLGTLAAGCSSGPAPAPASAPAPGPPADVPDAALAALEDRFAARLGVFALDTGSGRTVVHRADERFAFCSTFKVLAAAALLARLPVAVLDGRVVRYGPSDLMRSSSITRARVASGMTLAELCDAAVRHSDGTAGNLLLRELGGPAAITAYTRGLGDPVTRMDRLEPVIADAVPGDVRDTTSPRAFASDLRAIVLGDALPPDRRRYLVDLLDRSATPPRIRLAVPRGWRVADKTGHGDFGALNDVGVIRPPSAPPIVVALLSTRFDREAHGDPALLVDATRYVLDRLR